MRIRTYPKISWLLFWSYSLKLFPIKCVPHIVYGFKFIDREGPHCIWGSMWPPDGCPCPCQCPFHIHNTKNYRLWRRPWRVGEKSFFESFSSIIWWSLCSLLLYDRTPTPAKKKSFYTSKYVISNKPFIAFMQMQFNLQHFAVVVCTYMPTPDAPEPRFPFQRSYLCGDFANKWSTHIGNPERT